MGHITTVFHRNIVVIEVKLLRIQRVVDAVDAMGISDRSDIVSSIVFLFRILLIDPFYFLFKYRNIWVLIVQLLLQGSQLGIILDISLVPERGNIFKFKRSHYILTKSIFARSYI